MANPGISFSKPVRDHRWYRAAYLAVTLGAILLLCTLAAGAVVLLQRTQQTALEAAEARAKSTALLVVNTVNRHLLEVDGALASLPSLFASAEAPGKQYDAVTAGHMLQAFNFETFAYRDLLLARPDGSVWASARPRPRDLPLPFPISALWASQGAGVAIEGPISNPSTGEISLFLTRSISIPEAGAFEAVAEVPVPFVTTQLAPIADVSGLRVEIQRPDGRLLASLPYDPLNLGKPLETGTLESRPQGVAFNFSPGPGKPLLIGVWGQTLYPDVDVVVTIDRAAALADWYRDRTRILIVLAVIGLLVFCLSTALLAALRQREVVEAERKRYQDMLDNAIDAMADGFVMWDAEDRLVTCNRQFRELYAVSAQFIRPGARFEDIMRGGALAGQYPQAGTNVEEFVTQTIDWHRSSNGTLERLLPDGRWLLITERRTPDGGTVGIRTDITALKRALSDLAQANDRVREALAEVQVQNEALTERDRAIRTQNVLFTAALNNMSQGLLMVDSEQRLIVCNHRFLDIFRLDERFAQPGTTATALFHEIGRCGVLRRDTLDDMLIQQERIAEEHRSGTFIIVDSDRLAVAVAQRPLSDGGWVATYEDVTEQQRAEGRIRFLAHHDSLTKLPNRVQFRARMEEALSLANAGDARVALLYLDLDKFKFVNDTLGHPAGDALLEAAAKRLRGCVRDSDIVARLGGDEFAIGMSGLDIPGSAIKLAQRVIEALSRPYELGIRRAEVGVSVGIAVSNDSDQDCDVLMKQADMALYQAKARRGTYAIFAEEMESRLNARLTVEADLRLALESRQFHLVYQPIFGLAQENLLGFEALLRWNHPERGTISPAVFIPLAEELGIINAIGSWIFRQVCIDIQQIPEPVTVAVNLSPVQLQDHQLLANIEAALFDADVNPSRIEVEITESALLSNSPATSTALRRIHELGLKIALDDFGTGYSSLSHLRSFPFDKIKIDRLFVSEMATREDCAAIVSSVVGLAGKLGMTTTAEGVETEEQLRLVREAGCTAVQGYLLGRPQSIEAANQHFRGFPERIRPLEYGHAK